jgi:hypothetical protein
LMVNNAVIRKEIKEIFMLSTEGNKTLTWPLIDFASSVVMETS